MLLCFRPKLTTENGHLYIIAAGDKNITFRTSGHGFVNLNGDDLLNLAHMVSFKPLTIYACGLREFVSTFFE